MKPSTTKILVAGIGALAMIASAAIGATLAHQEHGIELRQILAEQKTQGERLSRIEGYIAGQAEAARRGR